MSDDATEPNPQTQSKWQKAYKRAEESFDIALSGVLNSPWSLAIFTAWTVGMVCLGMWIGHK